MFLFFSLKSYIFVIWTVCGTKIFFQIYMPITQQTHEIYTTREYCKKMFNYEEVYFSWKLKRQILLMYSKLKELIWLIFLQPRQYSDDTDLLNTFVKGNKNNSRSVARANRAFVRVCDIINRRYMRYPLYMYMCENASARIYTTRFDYDRWKIAH